MAEPLAVALHALHRFAPGPKALVVVAGCGPIGGLVALLAARAGHQVAVIDRNERRASLVAEAAGAQVTTLEAMAQLGFHYAIDTAGNDQVIAALVETIGGCGTLALVGIGRPAAVIDPVKLVEREITLVGCDPFGAEPVEVVALAAHLDAFIAEQIPLEAVPDAYARHLAGQVDGLKTIILCG
jgi:(R,R)-butanediol dehydrogenase/meso-butanediol dehydrogenase/diacetyl reductase